jgi:hypothetical protein
MRNYLTTIRLKYDITGSAYSEVMTIALKDPNTGKTSYLWAEIQAWVALREWYKRCEYQLVFMKSNVNKDGSCSLLSTSGRPVYIGSGLMEQIAPSNRRSYTDLTPEFLEDFLMDLSYNILGTNERKFVALAGDMFIREFDLMLKRNVASMTLVDTVFVTGKGDNLVFGGQFKTLNMTNGISLTVRPFALFNDPITNRQLHPVTKKPIGSYSALILDIGLREGKANVVKVVRKGREFMAWCAAGSTAPSGGATSANTLRSNGKDGYTVFFLGEMGIMLRDPRACAYLFMDVE